MKSKVRVLFKCLRKETRRNKRNLRCEWWRRWKLTPVNTSDGDVEILSGSQRIEERKCREEKRSKDRRRYASPVGDGVEEQTVRRRRQGGELVGASGFFSQRERGRERV